MNIILHFVIKPLITKLKRKFCRCSWSSIFNFQCSVLEIIMCPFVDISPPGHERPCKLLSSLGFHFLSSVSFLTFSEFALPNDSQLGRNHIWIVYYKDFPFCPTDCFSGASTKYLKIRFTLVEFPTNSVARNTWR
jgi:hypothetical protein